MDMQRGSARQAQGASGSGANAASGMMHHSEVAGPAHQRGHEVQPAPGLEDPNGPGAHARGPGARAQYAHAHESQMAMMAGRGPG